MALERLNPFCSACEAIPAYGYCNLKGCPMTPPDPRAGEALDEQALADAAQAISDRWGWVRTIKAIPAARAVVESYLSLLPIPQAVDSGAAIEVCSDCDIANCRHIRERALAATPAPGVRKAASDLLDFVSLHGYLWPNPQRRQVGMIADRLSAALSQDSGDDG